MHHTLFAGLGIGFFLIFAVLGIAAFVFWIVALVDVIRRQFANDATKILWACVVFFLHFLGALIYWFVGRPSGRLSGYY